MLAVLKIVLKAEIDDHIKSFNYIADENSRILILGSIPGKESLAKQQYYAHPKNLFWPFMSEIFSFDFSLPYQCKAEMLKANHVALWDVIENCRRTTSLDSDIKKESVNPNNFLLFFKKHPNIKNIFFNGKMAEHLYLKTVLPFLGSVYSEIQYHLLPSTSPANASISKKEKFQQWLGIKDYL